MMRWLVIGVTALAVLWSGYWFVGSAGVSRGLDRAAEAAAAQGVEITWEEKSVAGFPNRFDTTLTAPRITTPVWRWEAPFVQAFALSYRPNHLIAVLPPSQVFQGPAGPFEVLSEDLRASVVVAAGPSLTLRRATLAAEELSITSLGEEVTLRAGQIALREVEGPETYDIALGFADLGLPPAFVAALPNPEALPTTIGALRVDGTAQFDAPLDRRLQAPPGLLALELRDAQLNWGGIEASLSGRIEADAEGRAEGELLVRLNDLDAALEALRGVVPDGQLTFARGFLAGFTVDGSERAIEMTLPVRSGVVALGPIPLIPLPPLTAPRS